MVRQVLRAIRNYLRTLDEVFCLVVGLALLSIIMLNWLRWELPFVDAFLANLFGSAPRQ